MIISYRGVLHAVRFALGKINEIFERCMDHERQYHSLPSMRVPAVKKEASGERGQRRDIAFRLVCQEEGKEGTHRDSRDEYRFTGNPKLLVSFFHGLIPVLPPFRFQILNCRPVTRQK